MRSLLTPQRPQAIPAKIMNRARIEKSPLKARPRTGTRTRPTVAPRLIVQPSVLRTKLDARAIPTASWTVFVTTGVAPRVCAHGPVKRRSTCPDRPCLFAAGATWSMMETCR
jgi:hypothetical protein